MNPCFRCENYAITLLEQCENLEEVETMLQTKTHDNKTHKDANYIIAILDSRKGFVAHERFQYVLLKKFGEIEGLQVGQNLLQIRTLMVTREFFFDQEQSFALVVILKRFDLVINPYRVIICTFLFKDEVI